MGVLWADKDEQGIAIASKLKRDIIQQFRQDDWLKLRLVKQLEELRVGLW